jgi:eukaryotic-like serine/threonine-protein kinase
MSMAGGTLGHYEILGRIGSGGMGEVFSAHDPSLGRRVAIKMLPSRLASDPDTLSRFTQESRSASALNHPNIVTIHEVGSEEGSPFIVMEYIDGRDLRTMIAEGALTPAKTLDFAVQIADGLAAAHDRGIVHRDLKPENIMVTRDGYVKILDFGLAKVIAPVLEGDTTVQLEMGGTNPGTILGTVGYMSPEQATGKRIDFRSDQFTFGTILYELLTAKPAFHGETAIDTLAMILHKDPLPLSRVDRRIPEQLGDIVRRLLAKTPSDRYSSTRDLANELRLLRDRIHAVQSGASLGSYRSEGRRGVAIVAIVLAAFVAGMAYLARRPAPEDGPAAAEVAAPVSVPRHQLVVMKFRDLTGDPAGHLVATGFAETLTARLAGYPTIQIIRPPPTLDDTSPETAARDLGADLVLTGSMMRSGDRMRVTYSVSPLSEGREWRDLIEGNVDDLFALQDAVARSVARNLDLGTAAVRPLLDPAVSQRRYLEAIGHLRQYHEPESVEKAVEILQRLGPSASVQAALARAYLMKYRETKDAKFALMAGTAADAALEADPLSLDVNVTLGELRRETGRYPEAISAFLRVLSQQPNHADAVLELAETYRLAGDVENAESTYKRAIQLQPNYWAGYNKLGVFYFLRGRTADAVPMFSKVVELSPDNLRGYNNLGAMYQRLGRHDEAIRVFTTSIQRSPSAQAYSNLGTCYYFLGRYREAAAAVEKAVELSPTYVIFWRNLGDAYRWIPGKREQARAAYRRAIELCEETIAVNPSDAAAHATLATCAAKLGDAKRARGSILRALELEPQNAAHAYEAAVIANVSGLEEEVLARLEQALRLGFNPDDVMADPEFANLRKNGKLAAIIPAATQNAR